MDISTPDYNVSKLTLLLRNKFFHSLKYLSEVLNEEHNSYFENDNNHSYSWIHYYYYNRCISSLRSGNIDEARFCFRKIDANVDRKLKIKFRAYNRELSSDEYNAIKEWIEISEEGKVRISELKKQNDCDDAIGKVQSAIDLIEKYLPEFYDEYSHLCDEIILIGRNGSNFLESGSSFELYGLNLICYRNNKTVLSFLESIIHEVGHLALFAFSTEYELVLNSKDEKYLGPFRTSLRTMGGNYHAMFVLCRILSAFDKISAVLGESEELTSRRNLLFKRWEYISHLIEEKALLSSESKELFKSCKKVVSRTI
ncbi:MAG: HEXXH motif-containing putative peptide modification protein [Bdellovibrionota bacterium]